MVIVILGGGIVGLTMANLLARNTELQIILLEPNKPVLDWDDSQYDLRCSAITRAAQNVFTSLGVWQIISAQRYGQYDQMLVWDQEVHQHINFNAKAIGAKNLGYIVENRIITKALYQQLVQYKNVSIINQAVNKLTKTPNGYRLAMNDREIECKLLIGADGANSWLRNYLQIPAFGWDYKHSALVATIETQLPHANMAMQRFMPDGPLAFLPLMEANLCSIVWSSDPAKIQMLLQLDAEHFCARLAAEFSFKLGTLKLRGARASFALRMLHATNYVLPHIALIGDAAHVIHPLAGQGLNLGILDAVVLDEIIQQALKQRHDFASLSILRKYERNRKAHNISVIALMEGIKRTFANNSRAFTMLRTAGISLINNLDPVKNAMMRFAEHVQPI